MNRLGTRQELANKHPRQKAFDAIGGKDALLELRSFSYSSSGERFNSHG